MMRVYHEHGLFRMLVRLHHLSPKAITRNANRHFAAFE